VERRASERVVCGGGGIGVGVGVGVVRVVGKRDM
jgi:hypothetical protein